MLFADLFFDRSKFIHKIYESKLSRLQLSSLYTIERDYGASGIYSSCLSLEANLENLLLTGESNGKVCLYNIEQFQFGDSKQTASNIKRKQLSNASISSIDWYPNDSGCFIFSSFNHRVVFCDTENFQDVEYFDMKSPVYKSKFHSNGVLVGACLLNGMINLCDLRSGDCANSFSGHSSAATCLDWSPISDYTFTSSSKDGKILMWDIRKSGRDAIFLCLDWQQDYTAVAKPYHSNKTRKRIATTDVVSYRKLSNFDHIRAHEAAIMCVKYTQCGRYILSFGNDKGKYKVGKDGLIRCWDTKDGVLLPTQYDSGCVSNLSYDIVLSSCSNNNHKLRDDIMIAPSYNNSIAVSNIYPHPHGTPTIILKGHLEQVTSIVYRKYYQQIVSASRDGNILVWSPSLL